MMRTATGRRWWVALACVGLAAGPWGCSSKLRVGVQILNASYLDSPDVVASQMRQKEADVSRDLAAGRLDAKGNELILRAKDAINGPAVQDEVTKFVDSIGLDKGSKAEVGRNITTILIERVTQRISDSLARARSAYGSGLTAMTEARKLEAELTEKKSCMTGKQMLTTNAQIVEQYHAARAGFAGGDDELNRLRNGSYGLIAETVTAGLREVMESMAANKTAAANRLQQNLEEDRDETAKNLLDAQLRSQAFREEEKRLTPAAGPQLDKARQLVANSEQDVERLTAELVVKNQHLLDGPDRKAFELQEAKKLRQAAAALAIKASAVSPPPSPAAEATSPPAPVDVQKATEIKAKADGVGVAVGGSVARAAQRLGLTAGLTILEDPLASLVVYAPPQYWKGIYNEAFGKTVLGNSDIAIIMDGPGQFTIKGVRMDGSKVTQATFSVLKQSMQIAAAAAGVPFAFPSAGQPPATGQPADLTADPNVIAIRDSAKNTATAQNRRRNIEQQRLMLLSTVLAQSEVLEQSPAPDSAVKSSYDTVKRMLDSVKKSLPNAPTTKDQ